MKHEVLIFMHILLLGANSYITFKCVSTIRDAVTVSQRFMQLLEEEIELKD